MMMSLLKISTACAAALGLGALGSLANTGLAYILGLSGFLYVVMFTKDKPDE